MFSFAMSAICSNFAEDLSTLCKAKQYHDMKILVTGASGFIGSFIVEEALKRGMDTWAAMRKTSSKEYLQDNRINFIELDFGSEERLTEQLRGHEFDYIVHAAGATKCKNADDFYRVNTDGTRHFVNALLALDMPVRKFIFVSSLSVFGAVREEEPHQDILSTDTPRPNTHYGKSKLAAEQFLKNVGNRLNYTILRPSGVYGPREKDYFLMVKSISQHSDFAVGYSRQDITFVYVTDVVQAVFLALEQKESGKAYFLTDGGVYESSTFSCLIRRCLGNPWWLRLTIPIWTAKIVCSLGDLWGRISGKVTALNNDKYYILTQRNWQCDVETTRRELGYNPQVTLEEGVKNIVEWYKQAGWIS